MPPEDYVKDFIVKCRTPTGEWQELSEQRMIPANLSEFIDLAEEDSFTGYPKIRLHGDDAVEIIGPFKCPSEIRKRLSRKRLKKVLMSFGVPRNIAEEHSRECVRKMEPFYREILVTVLFYKTITGDGADG